MVNHLGAKDLCAILKSCHTAGVSKFQLGDLLVEFDASSRVDNSTDQTAVAHIYAEEKQGDVREEVSMMTAEQQDNFDEIAEVNLLMSDPEAYESKMIDQLSLS